MSVGVLVVVLGFALGAASGCTLRDADREVAIELQLAVDPTTTPYELSVSVEDGIARLDGQTRTRAEQRRAIEIASAVRGIRQVHSNLTLLDSTIEQSVIDALARDVVLGGLVVEVDVKRGVVRLDSAVTNASQRERALEIVRRVDGVTGVEDFMR